MEKIPHFIGDNKIETDPLVYPPMEDTWFLTDVLIKVFRDQAHDSQIPCLICELGIGTGYISTVLAQRFPHVRIIGVDISSEATRLAYNNLKKWISPERFEIICGNILDSFNSVNFKPDFILFNPPYVFTPLTEFQESNSLIKSWAGGPGGITVIQHFLRSLVRFSFSQAFFLTSNFNQNEVFEMQYMDELSLKPIAKRLVGDEQLICYQVTP